MIPFVPNADTSLQLRRAFGHFGTGVTVITTQTEHGPLGMTANSFSSISLDPALVLWSPALSSKRHDAFATAQSFCIHILAADQHHIAQHFAAQGHDFGALDWAPGLGDAPTLSDCLVTFHCETHAVHPAGDHSLIIGRVSKVSERGDASAGLMFHQGKFGSFQTTD